MLHTRHPAQVCLKNSCIVRPEPQSLSPVPTSAVNNAAADSEAMEPPETEMLAPGDASSLYFAQMCLTHSCLTAGNNATLHSPGACVLSASMVR